MKLCRVAAIFLALIIIVSAAGCGKNSDTGTNAKKETGSVSSKPDDSVSSSDNVSDSSSAPSGSSQYSDVGGASIDYDSMLDDILNGNSNQSGYTTSEVAKGQYSIVTGISARLNSARISMLNAKNCGKLPTEKITLCEYSDVWAFNHAACITYFKGTFYVTWMQGRANEDDLGQRIMCASSNDFYHWSAPSVFSDTMYGPNITDIEAVQQPGGFFNNGNSLIALCSVSEYKRESLRYDNNNNLLRPMEYEWAHNSKFYKILNSDGSWGSAVNTRSLSGGNHSAIQLKSGRWIFPASTSVRYSDDQSGFGAWYTAGLSTAQIDDAYNRGAIQLCEASAYETDDGVLHLLMRSETQYLWHTQSFDNGETWSDAYPTNFTNDKSKFATGRLPDGRYYVVSNTVYGSQRNPLTICVSEDGYNFDKEYIIGNDGYTLRKSGLGKGGVYGYPTCTIVGDYFYTVYSIGKEEIEISRFKLDSLK